jgi:hypothetical protein
LGRIADRGTPRTISVAIAPTARTASTCQTRRIDSFQPGPISASKNIPIGTLIT